MANDPISFCFHITNHFAVIVQAQAVKLQWHDKKEIESSTSSD